MKTEKVIKSGYQHQFNIIEHKKVNGKGINKLKSMQQELKEEGLL